MVGSNIETLICVLIAVFPFPDSLQVPTASMVKQCFNNVVNGIVEAEIYRLVLYRFYLLVSETNANRLDWSLNDL